MRYELNKTQKPIYLAWQILTKVSNDYADARLAVRKGELIAKKI